MTEPRKATKRKGKAVAEGDGEEARFLHYIGPSQERVLYKSDFQRLEEGSEIGATRWNAENMFSVPVSELSEAVVESLLAQDPDFVLSDGDKYKVRVEEKVALAGQQNFVTSQVPV